MNRQYHAYSEADTLEYDIQHRSGFELEELYGIILERPDKKTGKVTDAISGKEYASLSDWVVDQLEEEAWSDSEVRNQNGRRYEDY